jgi:hypothetical protein
MEPHVNLDRKFHQTSGKETSEEIEQLANYSDSKYSSSLDWPGLLNRMRVVVLAEAGAGKTYEMKGRSSLLRQNGKYAFFFPLEALTDRSINDILDTGEETDFLKWKADDTSEAWFFFDARDELVLRGESLEKAIHQIKRALDGRLERAHILFSSRPSDWRPSLDNELVNRLKPEPKPFDPITKQSLFGDEAAFWEAFTPRKQPQRASQTEDPKIRYDIVNVVLLPLSRTLIRQFAEAFKAEPLDGFLSALTEGNLWNYANRPQDLIELIEKWNADRELGTASELVETYITAKIRDGSREESVLCKLPDEKAREGAERLALALSLTKQMVIAHHPKNNDSEDTAGALNPADILTDWAQAERVELLNRGLFDPATYGRVRFHHRSVQEFLAAKRLKHLSERELSKRVLHRLLFADKWGISVVLPSMSRVAAWLALWDRDVRKTLIQREPEALFTSDPESLPLSAKRELLHSFVNEYGTCKYVGVRREESQIRRIADPALAPTIRELLTPQLINEDSRSLLLDLIEYGSIRECKDICIRIIEDASYTDYHRFTALHCLVEFGNEKEAEATLEILRTSLGDRFPRMVAIHLTDLFPKLWNVEKLLSEIEAFPNDEDVVFNLSWRMTHLIQALPMTSDHDSEIAVKLRDSIADLIWRGKCHKEEVYSLTSRFSYLSESLAVLCARQIESVRDHADEALIRACVIAVFFQDNSNGSLRDHAKELCGLFTSQALREKGFWGEWALFCGAGKEKRPSDKLDEIRLVRLNLISNIEEGDRPWLERALVDPSEPERQEIAMDLLLQLWRRRGRNAEEADQLKQAVMAWPQLANTVEALTAPLPPRKRNDEFDNYEAEQQKKDARQRENWAKWRNEVIEDPKLAFESPDRALNTVRNLYEWLWKTRSQHGYLMIWDSSSIARAFGGVVAAKAGSYLMTTWRHESPFLPNQRPSTDKALYYSWIFGLNGVFLESLQPGWSKNLSDEDARKAAVYAGLEGNHFPRFTYDLVETHPVAVQQALGSELSIELKQAGEVGHLDLLSRLSYAEVGLKQLFIEQLTEGLSSWVETSTPESSHRSSDNLEYVFKILNEAAWKPAERTTLFDECKKHLERQDLDDCMRLIWLKGAYMLDAASAVPLLEQCLVRWKEQPEFAYRAFAEMFGDHPTLPVNFVSKEERATTIKRVTELAYDTIRPSEDHHHKSGVAYSPDLRDEAERARGFLIHYLANLPGENAYRDVLELIQRPDFANERDYWKKQAIEKTAREAESSPWTPKEVLALEKLSERLPIDRDSMFNLMMDRLKDLNHDLLHHDFSDRVTLSTIKDETGLQRSLAYRLLVKSKDLYEITREDEVASGKKTDIRFHSKHADCMSVIEIKIVDSGWSGNDLLVALKDQLVGKYLRHDRCKAGCLLLAYDGTKQHWENPEEGTLMNFSELVHYLREKAIAIEKTRPDIRLSVFGLDLSDGPRNAGLRDINEVDI